MIQLLLGVIYLAFISLGLPDAMLGAAWPVMHVQLGCDLSYAGILSMIISAGTILSSLMSDAMTRKLGAGRVTAISVGMTAAALFGFSISGSFWMLCLWGIPYGLGAGSVDAALNNYVALHYESRHMSWLHCFWGLGASIGPYIMGFALSNNLGWPVGYQAISLLQVALTVCLFASLPLWKKPAHTEQPGEDGGKALTLPQVFRIPGAKEIMLCFFCYCALEQTAILWSASYLTLGEGMHPEAAASFASMFLIGITIGRAASGFLTMKLTDTQMIRLGQVIIGLGIAVLLLPVNYLGALAGLSLVGLGCAPVYPCIIHSTPAHFGADKSQALVGVQMASAYVGILLMPPLFGAIAEHIAVTLMPGYLAVILAVMVIMHERMVKKTEGRQQADSLGKPE